jgi:hypothetical protein
MSILSYLPGSHGHTRSFSGQTAAHFSRIADLDSVLIGTFHLPGNGFRNENAGTLARLSPQTNVPASPFLAES